MVCCFSHSVLTKAEREAIARLREQRAEGRVPGATTHRAAPERLDPVVTFYSSSNLSRAHRPPPPSRHAIATPPRTRTRPRMPLPTPLRHPPPHRRPKLTMPASAQTTLVAKLGPVTAITAASSSSSSSPSLPIPGKMLAMSPRPRPPQPRTAHQRKAALRRAARHGPSASDLSAKSSLLAVARDALLPDGGMRARRSASAHESIMPTRVSNAGTVQGRGERIRDGASALVGAIKSMSVWQVLRLDDAAATDPDAKQHDLKDKDKTKERSQKGKDKDKIKGTCTGSDDDDDSDNDVVERPVGRIAWAGRKKLDDVMSLFGGHSAKGERFVMKQRPELSDLGESNDDAYFQELMKGD